MNASRKTSSSRGGAQEKEQPALSLDYDHLRRLCLKHWQWLAGGLAAGILGGLIFAAFQTPIYEATATIIVPSKDPNVPGVDGAGQTDNVSGDLIKTFAQLLRTKDLLERVVKSERLNESSEFLPKDVPPPISEGAATDMLMGDVSIHIEPMTRLIDITVDHPSPKMAQLLANRLAQESIAQEFDQQTGSSSVLSNYLEKEVARLRPMVAESERALREYQSTHNMGTSIDNPEDVLGTRLKDLNQQYMKAQADVTLLKERYGESHPKLVQAEEMVKELRDELNKAQTEAGTTSSQTSEYTMLKSEADSYRTQLNTMTKGLQDAQAAVHVTIPGLRVTDEADMPWAPVRPSKTKAIAAGGFLGLICGLGYILALYFIDSSIRTVAQAEATLNVPVIAAVPILTESDGKSILPTFSDPQSFVAEAFRGLRASLLLQDRESPLKTILVCSAIPGEGKSFCAANLAVAFAQAGLRTLLIDSDLRLPTLHTYFSIQSLEEGKGFLAVLAGRSTLAAAVVPSPIPTLDLLLTTVPADSPAELLSGTRPFLLLDEAARKYDRVVIDSAPLNAVSDTMLIMPKADAILLVVRAAQTPANESKAALQKVYSSRMKPLGIILNYLAAHTLKSYAYGYSYGQKPKEKNAK